MSRALLLWFVLALSAGCSDGSRPGGKDASTRDSGSSGRGGHVPRDGSTRGGSPAQGGKGASGAPSSDAGRAGSGHEPPRDASQGKAGVSGHDASAAGAGASAGTGASAGNGGSSGSLADSGIRDASQIRDAKPDPDIDQDGGGGSGGVLGAAGTGLCEDDDRAIDWARDSCGAPQTNVQSGNACPSTEPVPLQLRALTHALSQPVFVTHAPHDDSRLFVLELEGRIQLVDPADGKDLGTFMVVPNVATDPIGGELGLLGLAFHPNYPEDPRFFVNYTATDLVGAARTEIASFEVMANDPNRGDPTTRQVLLQYAQPQTNHNGGMLAFGPDGCLYSASGDGGGAYDTGAGHAPGGNGQSLDTNLGKILRLDVDDPTSGAPGNLTAAGTPHIWDYGLRNPWRFSFDRMSGDLYIGDVGQNAYEEIDVEPRGMGHRNYGWNIIEGTHCLDGSDTCDTTGLVMPVDEYLHTTSESCVIGGYVYRGRAIPSLQGFYVYGDLGGYDGATPIRAFTWDGQGRCDDRTLDLHERDYLHPHGSITSFGEDAHGELYITADGVYRLEAAGRNAASACGDDCACVPGSRQAMPCRATSDCGAKVRVRTCDGGCRWSAWSGCSGPSVEPEAEVCNNGVDENCNGRADEGCGCGEPVAVGASGSFLTTARVSKFKTDSERCLVYGNLTEASFDGYWRSSRIAVFDGNVRDELQQVSLPHDITDFDLSPNGQWLVAVSPVDHKLIVIDVGRFIVDHVVDINGSPGHVEVGDDGSAYYQDDGGHLRSVDLTQAASSMSVVMLPVTSADLELTADGKTLFAAGQASPMSKLCKVDLINPAALCRDVVAPPSANALTLSGDEQYIYYETQHLSSDLSIANEGIGPFVAVDRESTFIVHSAGVSDAVTLRPVAPLFWVDEALLSHDDRELWTFAMQRTDFINVDELLGDAQLGQRELTPEPLAHYAFTRLLRDPARNYLYALDSTKHVVVVIDATTLAPLVSIVVGVSPTDLAIDLDDQTLYVGHEGVAALGLIDLGSLTFDTFLPTAEATYEIDALSSHRVAVTHGTRDTTLTVIDGLSGSVVADYLARGYGLVLSSTADGSVFFGRESGVSNPDIFRFDASGLIPTIAGSSSTDAVPSRHCTALPDGSGVFYSNELLDGMDFSVRFELAERIVLVTPDGRLATTATSILDAATGGVLGTLPVTSVVQAVSADSTTLYIAVDSTIVTVDLSGY